MPQDFATIFESRRSIRRIGPAPLREIVNTLAFATRPHFVLDHDPHCRSRRPSLSSGALHPIDPLLIEKRRSFRVMRYDAWTHRLEVLVIARSESLVRFVERCTELLPDAMGTSIVFAGYPGRVAAVYENHTSLLWRDAGALLQTVALAAAAYGLGFCPLGVLGGEVLEAIGLDPRDCQALGSAVIGRPR